MRKINKYIILKMLRLFNGYPLKTPFAGNGILLGFHRVVDNDTSQYNEILEISVKNFEFIIKYLLEQNYDFISIDNVFEHIKRRPKKKFVVITFDDGYKDNLTLAYPILKKYEIPFTIYITTQFPDNSIVLWWYLLEELVLNNNGLSFQFNGKIHNFKCRSKIEKDTSFYELRAFFINNRFGKLDEKINIIFKPFYENLIKKTEDLALSWSEIRSLSKDSLVTIGNHTKNHLALNKLSTSEIETEIISAETELNLKANLKTEHIAYPFGSKNEVDCRVAKIIENLGYSTAVTTVPGNIFREHLEYKMLLPRYLVCERISTYALNIRLNGIYSFLNNNYSKLVSWQ